MEFVQALAILAGVAISAYSLRNLPARTRRRSTIKADIEIYQLLDKADPQREVVKKSIDASLTRLYSTESRSMKSLNWTMLIAFSGMIVGFGLWTAYLLRDGFTWWAVATALAAFSALVALPEVLDPRWANLGEGESGDETGDGGKSSDTSEPPSE